MIISPVRPIGPDSFQRSESVQRSSPPRKTQETQDVSKAGDSRSIVNQSVRIQNKDVIALTPGLDDNLETAAKRVSAVFERVREQISNTLGLRGVNKEEAEQLLPPENATGKEVLAFFSPENTANRIVGFATSFIEPFLQSRSARPNEENVAEFSRLITGAIRDGFAEAQQILGNPDKESEVGSNIERTFELVLQGIKDFQESFLERSGLTDSPQDQETFAEEIQLIAKDQEESLIQPANIQSISDRFEAQEPINLEPVTNPLGLKDPDEPETQSDADVGINT